MTWRPQGILIDFYGTVAAGDRETVESVCRQVVSRCGLPLSGEEFAVRWGEIFFATLASSQHRQFRTLHECEVVSLEQTLQSMDCNTDGIRDCTALVDELEQYWRSPAIYPDALAYLASNDLPICCVSNADSEPLSLAIGQNGLEFDAVVTSEQSRCYKPEAAIFHAGLKALGLGPDEVIHIGDSLHSDIAGAAALGIKTVWIHRDSRIHDIGTASPDCTINVLSELIASPWHRLAG